MLVGAPGVLDGPVVTFAEGSAVRHLLERAWPDVSVAMELGSIEAVRAHAVAGVGPALLSAQTVAGEVARGELVVIERAGFPIVRKLVLEHRGVERLAPAAAALRALLIDFAAPHAP